MSFLREMGNVAATLGGGALLRTAWKPGNSAGIWGREAIAIGIAYGGNTLVSDKSPEEIKERIRNRAAALLVAQGLSADEVNQAFDQHYTDDPVKKPSILRNIGNQAMTAIGAGVGTYITTSIADKLGMDIMESIDLFGMESKFPKSDTIAQKAVVATGSLLGGYVGNKAWQGPSKKAIDDRAMDVVGKILAERKPPVEGMSQVEAFQHREEQRAQSTEKVR